MLTMPLFLRFTYRWPGVIYVSSRRISYCTSHVLLTQHVQESRVHCQRGPLSNRKIPYSHNNVSNNITNHNSTNVSHSFTAPPNIGASHSDGQEANPFKSWEHMSHKWMILTCVGCLCAGLLAGWFAEIDETKLKKPKFNRDEVIAAAMREFERRPDLAPTSLRVVFLLSTRRAGVQARSIDESCAVARGLRDLGGVIYHLSEEFNTSTEDTTSLIAIAAIRFLHGPFENILAQWRWDRTDSGVAPSRVHTSSSSSSSLSSSTMHNFLLKQEEQNNLKENEKVNKEKKEDEKIAIDHSSTKSELLSPMFILHSLGDLTEEECVALMGCHAVGEYHEFVSGVDNATHVGTRYKLNNSYYRFLLEHEKKLRSFHVERTEDNADVDVLPQTFVATTFSIEKSNKENDSKRKISNVSNSNNNIKSVSSSTSILQSPEHHLDVESDYKKKTEMKKKNTTMVTNTKKTKLCVFNKSEVDALLQNDTWRKIVIKYAEDEDEWRRQFESAFTKMIDGHFSKLRVYCTSDAEKDCNVAEESSASSTYQSKS